MNMRELEEIRERVGKAEGPDRELDDAVWMALCWKDHSREIARGELALTGSMEAALSLVDLLLPQNGWSFHFHRWDPDPSYHFYLFPDRREKPSFKGELDTAPLAILAALLSALLSLPAREKGDRT